MWTMKSSVGLDSRVCRNTDESHRWKGGLRLDVGEPCALLSCGLQDTDGKAGERNEHCGGLIGRKREMQKGKKNEATYENSYLL